MKKIFLIVFSVLVLVSCTRTSDKVQDLKDKKVHEFFFRNQKEINHLNEEKQTTLEAFISNLTLKEKISQLFIVNLEGDTVFVPVDGWDYIPGGYLFFSYNLRETPEKVMEFTDSIKNKSAEKGKLIPFLGIDQEGGFVNRLKYLNGPLPSEERVSENLSVEKAYELYCLQAKQMKALGFDLNFAPVVETVTDRNKDFLDGRGFGGAEKVLLYGKACVNAYEINGIGTVLKHFPGNNNTDPHSGLPELDESEELLFSELDPFTKIFNLEPSGVLMSHARTVAIDEKNPACLSEEWVTEKLKKEFGFKGIIFSDDIFMKALNANGFPPEKAVKMALEAGIDCIMISEKRIKSDVDMIYNMVLKNPELENRINESVKKIMLFKIEKEIYQYRISLNDINIIPCKSCGIKERIRDFEKAKEQNVNLYIENFN